LTTPSPEPPKAIPAFLSPNSIVDRFNSPSRFALNPPVTINNNQDFKNWQASKVTIVVSNKEINRESSVISLLRNKHKTAILSHKISNADYLISSTGTSIIRRSKSDLSEKLLEQLADLLQETDLIYLIVEPHKANSVNAPQWAKYVIVEIILSNIFKEQDGCCFVSSSFDERYQNIV
jgi:hypothetical protein